MRLDCISGAIGVLIEVECSSHSFFVIQCERKTH